MNSLIRISESSDSEQHNEADREAKRGDTQARGAGKLSSLSKRTMRKNGGRKIPDEVTGRDRARALSETPTERKICRTQLRQKRIGRGGQVLP